MSLLTKKQIAELACIASNQSTSKDLYEEFCEWNEKQTAQFEPDWSKAPDGAVIAVLSLTWVTNGNGAFGYIIAEYKRPTPVITPHPHAEMIAKYAEVAARRVDPWVEFEWGKNDSHWCSCDKWINFNNDNCYRHIGDDK
jgi:hypothetical protein